MMWLPPVGSLWRAFFIGGKAMKHEHFSVDSAVSLPRCAQERAFAAVGAAITRATATSFPRSAWERRPRRSASRIEGADQTRRGSVGPAFPRRAWERGFLAWVRAVVVVSICVLIWLNSAGHVLGAERPKLFDQTVKKLDIRFEPDRAKPGETVTLKITIEPIDGFHTYPTVQSDAQNIETANHIYLPASGPTIFVGEVKDPPGAKAGLIKDFPNTFAYPGAVTWELPAVINPNAAEGEITVPLKSLPKGPRTTFLVCDDVGCFNSHDFYSAKLTVLPGGPVPIDPKYKDAVEKSLAKPNVEPAPPKKHLDPKTDVSPPPGNTAAPAPERPAAFLIPNDREGYDYQAVMKELTAQIINDLPPPQSESDSTFWSFLLVAMFWGGVTLLTPCVFPMIPITVSYFIKQGEKKGHSPLGMASVYTLTIVLVLGLSAIAFLSFFRTLSINPWMNVCLGLLFVFFALSLFGMYDIVLPRFLVQFTSSKEGRGGYFGTIFMAVSFTIVSFTCVAPFLGGFSGMMASGKIGYAQLALGGFAFAATFAAPFFVLALFPSLIKKLPKSGGWMNTIKVVMGFLELAAAFKFFRTAELRWQIPTTLFTYDLVLSLWVILFVGVGLYLLNLYRLPHDEPQDHIGAPRMLWGLSAIGLGLYLLPGLFMGSNDERQRPGGTVFAWVDSFLLPEPGKDDLKWSSDLAAALEDARHRNESVFVDFTGVTCTNCRLNEHNVFPLPEVQRLLKKQRLVQLYNDTIPPQSYASPPSAGEQKEDALENLDLERTKFGTEQLPLYAILKPEPNSTKVKVVAVYNEGKINSVDRFVAFLKKGASN